MLISGAQQNSEGYVAILRTPNYSLSFNMMNLCSYCIMHIQVTTMVAPGELQIMRPALASVTQMLLD